MRITTLSVPFPGAKRPFEEGKKLGMWEFVLIKGEGSFLVPPADVYILAAWEPSVYPDLIAILKRRDGAKVGVMWTSSVGEMDMEPVERDYLREVEGDQRIDFIWFGDTSLARLYPKKGFYAPYPFDVGHFPYLEWGHAVEKEEVVTLFCPSGLKKNILNQLMAVKLAQRSKSFVLHTNVQGYDDILSELDHVHHPWMADEAYYRNLLTSAKVNLAVSWCETFNYQVAECGLLGTTSLVSPTIPVPGIEVENPNFPELISSKLLDLLDEVPDPWECRDSMSRWLRGRNASLKTTLEYRLPK